MVGNATMASTPSRPSNSALRSTQVNSAGACSGCNTRAGGGSKVKITAGRPNSSASRFNRPTSCAWPTWTPS